MRTYLCKLYIVFCNRPCKQASSIWLSISDCSQLRICNIAIWLPRSNMENKREFPCSSSCVVSASSCSFLSRFILILPRMFLDFWLYHVGNVKPVCDSPYPVCDSPLKPTTVYYDRYYDRTTCHHPNDNDTRQCTAWVSDVHGSNTSKDQWRAWAPITIHGTLSTIYIQISNENGRHEIVQNW